MIKNIRTYECKNYNALSYNIKAIDYTQIQLKSASKLEEELDMSEQFSVPAIYEKNDPHDDSHIITLVYKRPILAQAWAESGSSYVTYFLSKQSIEHYNEEQLKRLNDRWYWSGMLASNNCYR